MDADTLEAISVLLNAPKIWNNRKKYMNNNENEEEYNMCRALQEWIDEERNIGMEKGKSRINKLYQRLKADKRIEDVMRAIDDADYQRQLLREYGLQ